MTMGSMIGGSGGKATATVGAGIGAGAVLEFIKVGLELTSIRSDVREWLMMGITMALFSSWGIIAKRARRIVDVRERMSDK